MAGLCVPKVRLCVRARSIAGESTGATRILVAARRTPTGRGCGRSPEICHRMALLPGGATKKWLGLVLNVRYWHLADIDADDVHVCFRG
jgi:hypothetical protein